VLTGKSRLANAETSLGPGDEIEMACVYTGKDRAWFESLDTESQERVVEGDRINSLFRTLARAAKHG
jgi:hypothetical protein